MAHAARLFSGVDGQIVFLPDDFRFSSAEVTIRKDSETGDVILSEKPQT